MKKNMKRINQIMKDITYDSAHNKARSAIPWWYFVIGIDIFLVTVSIGKIYLPASEIIQFIGRPFNLAVEMNLAVWWSGLCLAVLGILSFEIFSISDNTTKSAWLALSILLLGLSLDEVGSLHERIGDWLNLLPYGLLCAALYSYTFYILICKPGTRKSAILITIAFVLYGSVAGQEYLEHSVNWPEWALGLRLGIEEGTELLATFLILISIVSHRAKTANTFSAIVPRLSHIKYAPVLISAGLGLHVISYFLFPELSEPSTKGNPLAWYPMVLFFLLFSIAYWKSQDLQGNVLQWKILAATSILCSAGTMWNLLNFVPFAKEVIPGKAFLFLLYLVPVLLIGAWSLMQGIISFRKIVLPLLLSIGVLIACLIYYSQVRNFTIATWSIVSVFYGYFILSLVEKLELRDSLVKL